MALLQEEEHLFKIRKMIKGIRFNINQYFATTIHRTITYSMLVYFMYVLYHLARREKIPKNFNALLQEKEYN